MEWFILYSDETWFSSEDGTWQEAPGRDVQIILYRHPRDGWIMRHGGNTRKGDFFRLDPGGHVVGMDLTGVIDHVVHETGEIKEGRMLAPDHWQQIHRLAIFKLKELEGGAT